MSEECAYFQPRVVWRVVPFEQHDTALTREVATATRICCLLGVNSIDFQQVANQGWLDLVFGGSVFSPILPGLWLKGLDK